MGLLQYLIQQSKLPTGLIGKLMLKNMNNAHKNITIWGLSQIRSCDKILDVSCGGGNALKMMAESGKFREIYGIDISDEAIDVAKKNNHNFIESGKVVIEQASVLNIPFQNSFFDVITTFQSHYHWDNVLQAVKEIYSKLKPNGTFVLVSEIYKIEYHMKEYNDMLLTKSLLIDSGFSSVNLYEKNKHICVIGTK